jgi:hypothetical protein
MADKMIDKKSWEEFKESGLLWFINRTLHVFGWAIVFNMDIYGNVMEVYPARVKFRGFDERMEIANFQKISKYMANNAEVLYQEAEAEE